MLVYETGIIGSLRWWFEVFVRGPRPYGDGLMRVWAGFQQTFTTIPGIGIKFWIPFINT